MWRVDVAVDKTLVTVITVASIAASFASPSFAQGIDFVEKLMRQVLPKEAVCRRGAGASVCDYDTPKFEIGLTGSYGDIGLGLASAIVKLKPPLETGQGDPPISILQAFFKPFNFDRATIVGCIGRGQQRNQWQPEEVKSADKKFKLKCYGKALGPGWTLIMNNNNEF